MIGIEEIILNLIDLPNTYIGEAPIDVDECQWIKTMAGLSKNHFNDNTYDRPTFNIYFRSASNKNLLKIVQDTYHKLKNYVGANYVILIERTPHYVGRDDKYRVIYTFQIEYQIGGY